MLIVSIILLQKIIVLFGVKYRTADKKFCSIGEVGAHCDLFGQAIFKSSPSNSIIIASGELDALSIYQMLATSNKSIYENTPVVSALVGEKSSLKQYQANYDFLNKFQKIYICPDKDDAGLEALHTVAKVLPRDKLFVIDLPLNFKDANDMLTADKGTEFKSRYLKAKAYSPSGIVGSDNLTEQLLSSFDNKKLSLPLFFKQIEDEMLMGGIEYPSIVNIVAPTGIGKCLAKGTLLRKADLSVVPVEDVKVGDRLLRPDGSFNTVLSLARGKETMYKISQTFGEDYTVNESHILSLKSHSYDNLTYDNLPEGTVVNISILDYLKLNKSDKKRLKGYKASLEKLPEFNYLNITEELAYLLGYWLGDGNTGDARITVDNKEFEAFNKLEDCANKLNLIYNKKQYPSFNSDISVITIKKLFKELDFFKLRNNKHIPNYFLTVPLNIKLNLIAGLIDSDGYKRKESNSYEITWKLKELAETFQTLIQTVGGRCSFTEVKKSAHKGHLGTYYRLHFTVPYEIPCALSRKTGKLSQEFNKNSLSLSTITVDKLEVDDYYGFVLDGDHLFCLKDFTVTHNTTVVNEIIYYWLFNETTVKPGILSLELNQQQYAKVLASRHLGKKLALYRTKEEALDYLNEKEQVVKLNNLFIKEDGSPRFYFLEEMDGKISRIKELIEELIISCGCKIIIIDPIQDLFEGLALADQEDFVKWLKIISKAYSVIFVCINHIRKQDSKSSEDPDRMYSENEVMGSGSIIKSSFLTILLNRNKYLDKDDPYSNVIKVVISKNRQTGITGPANSIYYDNQSHTLYDFEEYKAIYPEKFTIVIEEDKF